MDRDDELTANLALYGEKLLSLVASRLFRPKIGEPADELIERLLETQKNPPVVDRLLKSLDAEPRSLIALLGRSRQRTWKVEDLLALTASLGSAEGFPIIAALLDRGLLVAVSTSKIEDFAEWFAPLGPAATVVLSASVALRSAALPLALRPAAEIETLAAKSPVPAHSDGLDWPLRLAVARQLVRLIPVKLTQNGTLYKRDSTRFTADILLQSPLEHGAAPVEAGLLALAWARTAGLLKFDVELTAAPWPEAWTTGLAAVQGELFAGLFAISDWDPLLGGTAGPTATLTAGLLLAGLLADEPTRFHRSGDLAAWLWEHHPHWSGLLPKDADGGAGWVEAYLAATLLPLGAVESIVVEGTAVYRLTDLGRHFLTSGPAPAAVPAFPQTLLVQPNAEVLAYRQGLTPFLITRLTGFAAWKQIGAAGTLELTAESVTRGLEDGQTLASIVQTLDRHAMKPTPHNVHDLLRRWADKRERLIVYPSATLVEFAQASELDEAISRGIVSVRLTDRIGLTADGSPPPFQHLRLIGNRDYEATPSACVLAEDDGVTLRVDAAAADLLLDAEIARFAEALPHSTVHGDARLYRMTPETLRAASEQGMAEADLEAWFMARSGEGLPPAARLFFLASTHSLLKTARLLVLETPTEGIADGLQQWPATSPYIVRRIGPMALVVEAETLEGLKERLGSIGIRIENEA